MNIMNEYTLHHLRKNKRHTISIMIAIIIASSLLCSLCIYGHTVWRYRVESTIKNSGYWHGELWDSLQGDKLKYVTENPNVETTLIKGQWITAKLTDTKRMYLLMRDADKNYWKDMSEKNGLMEGRLPEKHGEILISKLFFDDNPSYKIGDTLTLPIGNRMLGNTNIKTQEPKKQGETFEIAGSETYTIVGKLDLAAISAYPGYIAMGYLERSNIQPDDELTVYMRMINPRKIYETLPQIAESVGFEKDEYGKYLIRYNTYLLNQYGIIDQSNFNLGNIATPLMISIIVLLIIGAFVLIIYNAFSLSANARVRQLGILKSIGATPKQIKYSVIYEGFILSIFTIPIGMITGYLFSNIAVHNFNKILGGIEGYTNIDVTFSWIVVMSAATMSLVTILISASIPGRKVSKMLSIEAVRQSKTRIKIKKARAHLIIKRILGIEGELAISNFSTHKRTFRTTVISLSMCFILMSGYICTIWIADLSSSREEKNMYFDMILGINITSEPSQEMLDQILSLEEIKDSAIVRNCRTTTYVETKQESDTFANSGGFAEVDPKRFNVVEKEGDYRIITYLIGLDDMAFDKYCKGIGTNAKEYYQNELPKGVLLNSTYHESKFLRDGETIPLLNVKAGEKFVLWEKTRDDMETNYQFNVEAGYVTEISPNIDIRSNRYSLAFVVPMEVYEEIVSQFMPDRALAYQKLRVHLLVGDEASPKIKENLTEISGSYLGSEDFYIWSKLERKIERDIVQQAVKGVLFAIAVMLGGIGISNAFSSIANNLKLRRREFAMLRSAGLTPKGLNKILVLEGLFFGFKPILVSIPFLFSICWLMLWITDITWAEFLPVFPVVEILAYAISIIVIIWTAYGISARSIKEDNVVEAIKDETLY